MGVVPSFEAVSLVLFNLGWFVSLPGVLSGGTRRGKPADLPQDYLSATASFTIES